MPEEKTREQATMAAKPKPSPSPPSASATPTTYRRKPKRKAKAAKPSPPPKRQARESPPPHTRQSPLNPAPEDASQLADGEREPPPPPPPPRVQREAPKLRPVKEEVEAVLSRGAGVHVVPTFAGWFSWKDIHQIEKQALPLFFDGISLQRTPDIYLEIRNFIMKKFHANPQMHLEFKDLSELSDGEMDARLEVFEFLSHWGLINFHPFPPAAQEVSALVDTKTNVDTEEKISLVDKLFQFETVQSYLITSPNQAEVAAPTHSPSLLSEPTLTEDFITQAESSVEYHCNSCSVDCSRKRHHCRTQADFDLCCDCYNEGKLDVGMSQTDFILMESAEIPGYGSTSWTDQETLLLLEALEIFQAKWSDIAEHVATKTKAQCMLHFLQMPIMDSFLYDGDVSETSQETAVHVSAEHGTSVTEEMVVAEDKAGIKTNYGKTSAETKFNLTETEGNLDDNVVANNDTKNSGDINVDACSNTGGSNRSSDTEPIKKETSVENTSNIVNNVLKSAFEAVGHIPKKEDLVSFTEAGNPVMGLAAFLSGLVDYDDATTLCCSSLKAISHMSPALQLATRHCFILQDPPNDHKDLPVSISPADTDGEQQKDKDATSNPNGADKDNNLKEGSALSVEEQNTTSTSSKNTRGISTIKESKDECPQGEPKPSSANDCDNPIRQVAKSASDNIRGHSRTLLPVSLNNTNESCSISSQETSAGSTKDTSDPGHVDGGKPIYEDPPLQGKTELNKIEHGVTDLSTLQLHESIRTSSENGNFEDPNSIKDIVVDDVSIQRLQRAAATAISAAAVKAELLAKQEEYQIQRLAALVIDKQVIHNQQQRYCYISTRCKQKCPFSLKYRTCSYE
ncbi:SWI/SNF complex subunit SWI3D-like isoform X2 [Oryza brachyantha]|uniref:SWI/SNF complex subunit SWI3D-like isoform X2 n=1 Tax=Oryza brachyantha TaxID=4533 RepID=UPI001ADBC204|nr:SWI/SNF complex subunit SWI3D-like isoform X2 [Oryza brachyantha]